MEWSFADSKIVSTAQIDNTKITTTQAPFATERKADCSPFEVLAIPPPFSPCAAKYDFPQWLVSLRNRSSAAASSPSPFISPTVNYEVFSGYHEMPMDNTSTMVSGAEVASYHTPSAVPTDANATYQDLPTYNKLSQNIDVASIIIKRFKALIRLKGNPIDQAALQELNEAQQCIEEWVKSRDPLTADVKVLSVKELYKPRKWSHRIKKDIFAEAAPVTDGKGMKLLKKMGWNPGEGLGKNKEGSLEPIVLYIKYDKKGLVSEGETGKKGSLVISKELQAKHPVSVLMKLCRRRKWSPPTYTMIKDSGPAHRKAFLFKVKVNGHDYIPDNPSSNKKEAKADAAIVCLQTLNIK